MEKNDVVVVFGYSDNVERYSNKAYNLLLQFEHPTIAFNPRVDQVSKIPSVFDTLTMYVQEAISDKFTSDILKFNFKRVIFNPGTENQKLENLLAEKGIEIVHGCTLVMLKTDQF